MTGQPEVIDSTDRQSSSNEGLRGAGALLKRPTFVISVLVVLWWIVSAVGWQGVGLDPLADTGQLLEAPSESHVFGTDSLGRDVFARVMAGSEPALKIGVGGAVLATLLGSVLGVAAGYWRGIVDNVIMRILDLFLALPTLILMFVLVGAFGVSTASLVIIVGVLFAPSTARIIRSAVLIEVDKDYITSARLQNETLLRILLRELLPNVAPTIIVQATLSLAGAIFMTTSLSFLGLGQSPPSPDWGLAINENRLYLQSAWWTIVFPAAAIASLVISAHLIADNIKEVKAL